MFLHSVYRLFDEAYILRYFPAHSMRYYYLKDLLMLSGEKSTISTICNKAILLWIAPVSYLIFFSSMSCFPFMDLPNHLTRAFIISDLNFKPDSLFHSLFEFVWFYVPYLMQDLVLGSMMRQYGVTFAGIILLTFSVLGPWLAGLYAGKALGLPAERLLILSGFLLYLSTNWFVLSGFTAYSLGFMFSLLAIGNWIYFLRQTAWIENLTQKKSLPLAYSFFALYVLSSVLAYCFNLAPFFFLALSVPFLALCYFIISLFRGFTTKSFFLFALSLLPFLCISLWHLSASASFNGSLKPIVYRPLLQKLLSLATPFYRFNLSIDLIFLFLLLMVFFTLHRLKQVDTRDFANAEGFGIRNNQLYLLLSVFLTVVWLCLPVGAGTGLWDIDNRAIPFMAFFSFIWILGRPAPRTLSGPMRSSITIVSLLALLNLAYLYYYFAPLNQQACNYQEFIETLPEKSVVLPVNTRNPVGRVNALQHQGSFYVLKKQGLIPYLFFGSVQTQFSYFNYRLPLPAPSEFWYERDLPVDWSLIAEHYDYVLANGEMNQDRYPNDLLSPIARSEGGVLYQVKKN